MRRSAILIYGVMAYAIFFATFLYAAGFVGNFGVPKSIDSSATGSFATALVINATVLALFALQHSVMARAGFKQWWTRIVPASAERSTYVLFSSVALIVLFAAWRPMGGAIWHVDAQLGRVVLYGLFAFGWLLVLVSTFAINHFDLFGLRQVWLHFRGRPYTRLEFGTPWIYKYVRHPLYVGWFFAFWATPTMTAAHLFFAAMTTSYILMAIRLEERDLVREHGPAYVQYRRNVPMLVPRIGRRRSSPRVGVQSATA